MLASYFTARLTYNLVVVTQIIFVIVTVIVD